jgi:hypothetical protein
MKTKKGVYIDQWLDFKPYDKEMKTDNYYLGIAGEIKKVFILNDSLPLPIALREDEINELSCFITSYFEDIISGTNIWNTFIKYHEKLYHKRLPFYNTDDYFENEVNLQDVKFLIWYYINTVKKDLFYSPFNFFIEDTAAYILIILEEEFEYAPENENIKSFYELSYDETDYYTVRGLIDRLLFGTYLFIPDCGKVMSEIKEELIKQKGQDENLIQYITEYRDDYTYKCRTRLLALSGKEWVAEILGNDHPLYPDLLNISDVFRGLFFYKGQDEKDIDIEYIASGERFKLTKKSFDYGYKLSVVDTILYIGIIRWREEWWFSGVYSQMQYDESIVKEEKDSIEKKEIINKRFNDEKNEMIRNILAQQYEVFLKINHNSPIAFMKNEKINGFMNLFSEQYNHYISNKKSNHDKQMDPAQKLSETQNEPFDYSEYDENGLVFFNPEKGIEIAFGVNSAFPLPQNPYFKKEECDNDTLYLLMDDSFSKELALYSFKNRSDKMLFFNKGVCKGCFPDMDFLLRFWKRENYDPAPSLTLVN